MSRFGGLWTYAAWTPIVDVPEADEDAHKVTWEHGVGVGVGTDEDEGNITIKVPGFYIGYAMLSFIGTTGVTYFFEFRVNGAVGAGFRATADGLTGGTVNVSLMGGANFNEGDVVALYIYCDEDGENLTLVDGQFGVMSM